MSGEGHRGVTGHHSGDLELGSELGISENKSIGGGRPDARVGDWDRLG